MSEIAELAVRTARAEIERDDALRRATMAEEAYRAAFMRDEEAMLDLMHICGIPARDVKDIYRVLDEWHRETKGAGDSLLEWWRERRLTER